MGASDQPQAKIVDGVSQELVTIVYDASEESVQDMVNFLRDAGVDIDRLIPRWNTWKGRYWTPPDDANPWSQAERDLFRTTLEQHPNVMRTDESAGDGSQG